MVKLLPPPPIKPRKGLRAGRGLEAADGVGSPLLTPSLLDEDSRKVGNDYFKRRGSCESRQSTDDDLRAARQKFVKRRRAELIRRASEVALLLVVGFLVICNPQVRRTAWHWHRGVISPTPTSSVSVMLTNTLVELISQCAVLGSLYVLYPVRLFLYNRKRRKEGTKEPHIRVPASFDPAPLLYPQFLPVFVALSLSPFSTKYLLPNIVLGLASIPSELIPGLPSLGGTSTVHWLLTTLPLVAAENTEWPSRLSASKPYMLKGPPEDGLIPEMIVSLYPLHQALLPPLQYLTTTSLLPAELQLLSISLIGLLFCSQSSQAAILRSLIWIGGISLFILCGDVLKWGVSLARIPKWKFRHAGRIVSGRQSFLTALKEGLAKGQSRKSAKGAIDSDADDDDAEIPIPRSRGQSLKLDFVASLRGNLVAAGETRSAVEPKKETALPNGDAGSRSLAEQRSRRNTLPTLPASTIQSRSLPLGTRRNRSKSSVASHFLSLTPKEATVRKWLYAGYVYSVIVAIILIPIRSFVSRYALDGQDPFGWAIGYLFGNIRELRSFVVNNSLEQWVSFPPLDPSSASVAPLGRAEYLRTIVIGPANTRLLMCGWCLLILSIGMLAVLHLTSIVEVDTRRKVFHGMMVAMLLPTIFVDPAFISLALALILAIFLLLDLIRASQLPPLSKPIACFLTPYVDGRDLRGPVVVSHIFLLIGCAIPLWLSLAALPRSGTPPWQGWDVQGRDVSMVAGVVCVGMGDAAASLIGRRYGRRKWPWAGGKSIEGSVAFVVAVTLGLSAAKVWGWPGQWEEFPGLMGVGGMVARSVGAACGASFMEAVLTGGNDNVVVPVVLWLLVRALDV